MPAVPLIAIRTLHKDARVAETLGKHLAANIIQSHPLADVAPRLFHHLVPVHVGQQAQAEALRIRGVREPVHRDRGLGRVKGLPHSRIQLVVTDGAPERRFVVHHGLGHPLRTRRKSRGT